MDQLHYLFNEPDFMDKYGDSVYFSKCSYCLQIPSKDQISSEQVLPVYLNPDVIYSHVPQTAIIVQKLLKTPQ